MTTENSSDRLPRATLFSGMSWRLLDVAWFLAVWIGIQLGLVLAAVLLRGWWLAPAQFITEAASGNNLVATLVFNVLGALIGIGLLVWKLRRYQEGWNSLGWRKVNIWRALLAVGILLVAFIAAASLAISLADWLIPGFDANQAQTTEFASANTQTQKTLAFIALVLIPPVLEETIFRGFMLAAFAKSFGYVWGAILSSVIFALAHGQANVGVYTFVLGLVLCAMYIKFRSIIPGIMLHMVNNGLAFWAMFGK